MDEFAARLIQEVRDRAIKSCDGYLSSQKTPVGRRWDDAGGSEEMRRNMITDCVDETIFWLLQAIDQEVLNLRYVSAEGEQVDLCQEGQGELSGWFMGSGGWRSRYSTQRYNDDFQDLA